MPRKTFFNYNQFLEYASRELTGQGYQVSGPFSPSEPGFLSRPPADGGIVLGSSASAEQLAQYQALEIPFVVTGISPELFPANTVSHDNYSGIRTAALYLKEMGHSCIGYLRSLQVTPGQEREQAWRYEIGRQGLAEMLPTFRERIAQLSVEPACSSIQNLQEWISGSLNLYEECIVNSSDQDAAIKTIKDYIQSHLDENMTRESLAAIVYLTPDYLSHLFKRETGFSLTNYIIYERIEEAKRLLAGTGLSISDIATRCGFQNISYFSKQFKRFTGVTPREFRG